MKALALVCIAILFNVGSTYADPVKTVSYVDPAQYVGNWYQIARRPLSFENGCVCSLQKLTAQADGSLYVYNTCNDQTPQGRIRSVEGTATNDDPTTNAKWTVDFGLGRKGGYWIVALDPQYRWAVVSDPWKFSLYVLSKTPELDPALYQAAVAEAATQFDTSVLRMTLQAGCTYP